MNKNVKFKFRNKVFLISKKIMNLKMKKKWKMNKTILVSPMTRMRAKYRKRKIKFCRKLKKKIL